MRGADLPACAGRAAPKGDGRCCAGASGSWPELLDEMPLDEELLDEAAPESWARNTGVRAIASANAAATAHEDRLDFMALLSIERWWLLSDCGLGAR
jgi:hypothetical protein